MIQDENGEPWWVTHEVLPEIRKTDRKDTNDMETKEIIPFEFTQQRNGYAINTHVTVIKDEEGNPWFVASEVCDILGYRNPWDAVGKHVRPHQKAPLAIREVSSNGVKQNRNKTIINEGGLYRLIMRSNVPAAEEFQDWVTDVVLPSIRKTGGYVHATKEMSEKGNRGKRGKGGSTRRHLPLILLNYTLSPFLYILTNL